MAKTFKSASLAGYGALGDNAKVLRDFVLSDPELLKQVGGPEGIDAYIKEHQAIAMGSGGDGGPAPLSAKTQEIDKLLSGYSLDSIGAAGMKNGRQKSVTKDGKSLFKGKAYSYSPAKDNLDTFLKGMAVIGGTAGIGSLASGMTPAAGTASSGISTADAAAALGGAGETAGGLGALEAGAGAAATTGGGAASALNPALIESAVGSAGYGASSAGLGGVTAGQTAAAAALNPYLNAIGKFSPELASSIASGTGGITSGLGSIADAILPSSVLSNVGGADGISGGLLGGLLGGKGSSSDWMKMLLPALAGYASYKDAKKPQLTGYSGGIKPANVKQTVEQGKYGPISRTGFASGGEVGEPRYLNSPQDGMQDGIAAQIDGKQAAALSGGEFVIPADVVSHLGNGNSNAGAKQLYSMMERIRAERTGNPQQGKQIQPQRFLPR
jgi:hypothetical protein